MSEKPLTETNPYLRDPEERKQLVLVAASSSSAIEGIHVPLKTIAKALRPGWKPSASRHVPKSG